MKRKATLKWIKGAIETPLTHFSPALHCIKKLFCSANQMTGFCMKCALG